MHIFVINLEKDHARRESISAQLEALGLSYEMIPAVYGAGLSVEDRSKLYDDRKAKLYRSRSLTPAEIGCALSHLRVYRTMIERGINYALILEDDVTLPSGLKLFLDECARCMDSKMPSVWLLSPAEGDKTFNNPVSIGASHHLLPYRSGFYTSSYLATLPAAQALLAEMYPVSDVADCWQRLHRYKVVDLFVVSPPLIEQNQEKFGSSTTTDYRTSVRIDPFAKGIYKARRVRSILCDRVYAPYLRWFRPYSGIKLEHME